MKNILKYVGIVLIMFIMQFNQISNVKAEGIDEYSYYSLGTTASGYLSDSNKNEFYRFTIPSSGKININISASIERMYVNLYNENKEFIQGNNCYYNSTTGLIVENVELELTRGTYYLLLKKDYSDGSYNFSINFNSANETFQESQIANNNTIANANHIEVNNGQYCGQIAINDTVDFYQFELTNSGKLQLEWSADIYQNSMVLYDEKGNELKKISAKANDTTKQISEQPYFNLTKGVYYLAIQRYYSERKYEGNYIIKTLFIPANESFIENNGGSNNTLNLASKIDFNNTYLGQIAINDSKDFYKINVVSSSRLIMNLSSELKRASIKVFDALGNEVFRDTAEADNTTGKIAYSNSNIKVNAGTYYLVVEKYYSNEEYEGTYSFNLGIYYGVENISFNFNKKILVNGKSFSLRVIMQPANATDSRMEWKSSNSNVVKVVNGKVTAVAPGVATIIAISEDNNNAKAECSVTVKPKPVTVKQLKKYKQTGFKIRFSKQNDVYYQVMYSKDKKFKKKVKSTTTSNNSYTVTGLKKGKYYVKVRAYIVKDNKKICGTWSKIKKIKIAGAKRLNAPQIGEFVKTYDSSKDPSPNHGDGLIYTVKWKPVKGASGYQVYMYENEYPGAKYYCQKSFTTSKQASIGASFLYSMKAKVRAYKVVDGKKYYGKWSKMVYKRFGK